MNLLEAKGRSFTNGEDRSFDAPLDATVLMKGNEPSTDTRGQTALAAHRDARELVRLVQCPKCSRPFRTPVTLPCGHTACRTCLSQPRPRENITYSNTPDRQRGIVCPYPLCGAEHLAGECSVDVTLTKVMELITLEIARHRPLTEDTPILLKEIVQWDPTTFDEKEKLPRKPHSRVLYGGRLISTFTFAELGELDFNSEVTYQSLSETDDEYKLDVAVLDRLRDTAHKELDCHICYNMMLDPTTTACGHTFCRKCLTRVLDHSNVCPVCRHDLLILPSLATQPSNARLVALLNCLCPELVAARASAVELEEHLGGTELNTPLFICTLALPTMPTFLHIFEPRYRLMIRRALEGNRQFGMIMYNRSSAPQGDLGVTQFMEYGTMLEIVNVHMAADGRSYIETKGLHRFRVRAHSLLDGYMVGRVERVEDVSLVEEERLETDETSAALTAMLSAQTAALAQGADPPPVDSEIALAKLSTCELLLKGVAFIERIRANSAQWLGQRIVDAYGGPPDDPALFPYWFACVLPIAEEEKYLLLKTRSVRERLKIMNRWIRRIEGQRW